MQALGAGGQTPPQTTGPVVGGDTSALSQLIGNAYPPDVQAPQGNLPLEAEAVVRGFKAKEPSFLGRMADAFLVERGGKPVYGPKKDQENMMRAMEGFTQDPMEALRRIAQIPGHQEQALQLYNQIIDNQRSQGTLDRQNKAFDLKIEEIARDRVASMLGAVQPGDAEGYAKMRQRALAYGQAKGFDFSQELPEDATQLDIDGFRYGEVPVARQMQLDDARTYRGQVLDERRNYHNTTAGISASKGEETARHNNAMENKPSGRGGSKAAANEPGLRETAVVRPGESMQIMREGDKIVAARVMRKDQYGRPDPILLSPTALEQLKKKLGQ